jgi:hypothetical protein
MTKPKPSPEILQEWDVTRRTAEFFDEQVSRVREIGVGASVAIIGIAAQFNWVIGSTLLPLNLSFLLIDRRARRYLLDATDYASKIEDQYEFGGDGLTSFIRKKLRDKRQSFTRLPIYGIYWFFAIFGLGIAIANIGNWVAFIVNIFKSA